MKVAIIGGGYAGMAAAVTLTDAGIPVTVFEGAPVLGGRARRVVVNDVALDNGLHILIGAYRETLKLVRLVHPAPERALKRMPLDWHVHRHFRLRAAPLPAPLHLVFGLIHARGATWRERYAAARFMSAMRRRRYTLDYDISVAGLLRLHAQGPQMTRHLWEPLCLAALNTPIEIASAQVFLSVLRDGLDAERSAGDLLLASHDLSSFFPEPAGAYIRERGGDVHTGASVVSIEREGSQVLVATREHTETYEHAICAVSPHRAAALLSRTPALDRTRALLEQFRYQPIYSVYLQFASKVPLPCPMLALAGGPGQWVFDRESISMQPGLVAVIISASGPHQTMTQNALAASVLAQLQNEFGPFPALLWHRVIAEKRATFECSVGLERPATRTPLANLHLAGDYTASEYPATLEAAVRSGIAAARQIIGIT
jgi:hydroxysqualene dehydroxylase